MVSLNYVNLHSNMFLLILEAIRWLLEEYIWFTFQYVSINTRFDDGRHISNLQIYIPICFY